MNNFEENQTDQKEQLMGDEALNKIRELLKHFRSAMLNHGNRRRHRQPALG